MNKLARGCAFLGLFVLVGCSDSEDSPPAEETGTGGSEGGGDGDAPLVSDAVYGAFTIQLTAANESTGNEAFSSLQGLLRDAPAVESIHWEFVREEGECALFVPVFPFCDPACDGGKVCVAGDECVPEPQPVSIGEVTFTGLDTEEGGEAFSISPIGAKFNYLAPASVSLDYPPAAEGAPITLSATVGGDSIEIQSSGISPLSVAADEVAIQSGSSTTVDWAAAGPEGQSEMEITLEISHHGGRKGEVVCTTADDGQHAIPESIISDLIELGYAGFPTVTFSRIARGISPTPHEISLIVTQNVQIPITIDGLVSCTTNDECPDGQTCQADRSCG